MTFFDLIQANLLSPPVLCFALGAIGALLGSDLKLPENMFTGLSIFLMLAIGLRGGAELMGSHEGAAVALLAAFALGCGIPLVAFPILRRIVRLSVPDSAAMAAHYGSVSAVTFAAVMALLDRQGLPIEGYSATLLAVMEVPAIVVAFVTARRVMGGAAPVLSVGPGGAAVLGRTSGGRARLGTVLGEIASSKTVLLLVGGLVIGALAGRTGMASVKPFFGDLFQGVLCLFLLDLGRIAASRIADFRAVGGRLIVFALVMPVLHAAVAILLAHAIGLSASGAMVLGTLAASSSYIAAPAAVRQALPEANAGYYLTCSLAVTFPFNIIFGLALYQAMVNWLYG